MADFFKVVAHRRSNYAIGKAQAIPEQRIREILDFALSHTPSAFNSQPAHLVLLLGKQHDRLWQLTWEALEEKVPAERLTQTRAKIDSFAAGYGTILYFIDQDCVSKLAQKFPSFADGFPRWALESTGMLQFVVWSALDDAGLGVSLQHYNPLIDTRVAAEWDISDRWTLLSQMVFGSKEAEPLAKDATDPALHLQVYS